MTETECVASLRTKGYTEAEIDIFVAGYHASSAALRERLAAAEGKRDQWLRIARRLFQERQTLLHGHTYELPTDDVILEAAIIDATTEEIENAN